MESGLIHFPALPNSPQGLCENPSAPGEAGKVSQMKKQRSAGRTACLLRQADGDLGTCASVTDVCRRLGSARKRTLALVDQVRGNGSEGGRAASGVAERELEAEEARGGQSS